MIFVKRRGQVTLEYVIIIIVVMGTFLAISNYVKRSLQGRWKQSMDSMADQYDPRLANSNVRHLLLTNSTTLVTTVEDVNGFWSFRVDNINSIEIRTGSIEIGGY